MNKLLVNKIKTIELLVTKLDIKSEKDLSELNIESLIDKDITLGQIRNVRDIKKIVKENKLFSFLTTDMVTVKGDKYE